MVGDWYFALDGRPPEGGRSAEPWREHFRSGEQALLTQGPSEHWVGDPWQEVQDPRGHAWLFGVSGADPATVARVAWDGGDPAELGARFILVRRSTDGELVLTTDRLGALHAYRGPTGFGSCMAPVARTSAKSLDWLGLAGYFAFGFFPDDRTFYDDVRIFRPARHYRTIPGARAWQDERYWHWHHEPDGRTYDATLDAFCELFVGIMGEMDSEVERLAIPISGGLDSRLTLAALTGSRPGRWAYSYGYGPQSVENRIARRLADRRDLTFDAFQIRPYLFAAEQEIMAAVEGFQDVTQTRQASVAEQLRRNADAVVAAHWGDVWLDDMGLVGRDRVGPDELLDHTLGRLRKRGSAWLLDHLCAKHLGHAPEPELEAWARQELKAYDHLEDPDFRVKAFKSDQWSFRWTLASLRAYQLGTVPRLPFYDPRLVDFFARVPTEYVAGRRLEIDAIKRLAPDLARVPWQVYDASLYSWQHFNTWLLPKRALKKAWRLLRRETVIERNWEVQFLNPEGRRKLEERLLSTGLKLHDLVSPSEVHRMLDRFWARPDGANGYTVGMLLTFSLWLEAQ